MSVPTVSDRLKGLIDCSAHLPRQRVHFAQEDAAKCSGSMVDILVGSGIAGRPKRMYGVTDQLSSC